MSFLSPHSICFGGVAWADGVCAGLRGANPVLSGRDGGTGRRTGVVSRSRVDSGERGDD